MFLVVLGFLDLIIGTILVVSQFYTLAGNSIVLFFAVIALLKGIYSTLTAAGSGFYFDILGWFDLISAVLLFLVHIGIIFNFFLYIGIIMIIKALYSIAMGLMG